MITDLSKKIIEKNPLAVATFSPAGEIHHSIIAYAKVINDNQILITDNFLNTTLKNLKNNPNVSLATWNKNWEEDCIGFAIKGKAEYFSEGEWLEKVKSLPENDDMPAKGAILFTVNDIRQLG